MKGTTTGSEAAALIARLDWARSPLGEANDWPQSLRTAVDIVLHSPMPMLLLWGSELTQLYNDSFALLLGNKHPGVFGQPAHQAWTALQRFTAPVYDAVLGGQVRIFTEQRFVLQRDHRDTEIWLDLTCSPVRDESGTVAGILVTAIETNERRRKARELQQGSEDNLQALRQSRTELQLIINAMPVLIGYVDHEQRFRLNNSAYLEWYGMTPQALYGKTIREVLGDDVYAGRADKIADALNGKACSFMTITPIATDGHAMH